MSGRGSSERGTVPPSWCGQRSAVGTSASGTERRPRLHPQVWKDAVASKAAAPYLVHELPAAPLQGLAFQPYEDTLAAGHGGGVTTVLVPGAGEPHFDSRVADPFQVRPTRPPGKGRERKQGFPFTGTGGTLAWW